VISLTTWRSEHCFSQLPQTATDYGRLPQI
jgi:hypothetical protein